MTGLNRFGPTPYNINGIDVYTDPTLPITRDSDRPNRLHKGEGKTSYSRRIQKKWNKRYGMVQELVWLTNGKVICCHPANYEILKSQLESAQKSS